MKESAPASPRWIARARGAWNSVESPPPSRKWTAHWVKKFVVYLERRNKGALPERTPSMGVVASFCRFIEEKWEVEDWQLEQARESLEWFAEAAGFGSGSAAEASCGTWRKAGAGSEGLGGERLASEGREDGEAGPDLGGSAERKPGVRAEVPVLPQPWLLDSRLAGRFSKWGDLVVDRCRRQGHSIRTEKTYEQWCRRFSDWWTGAARENVGAPQVGGLAEVVESAVVGFMDYLAVEKCAAAATQRQALNAVSFLVTRTLGLEALDFVILRFAALRCRRIHSSVPASCGARRRRTCRWS